MSDVKPPAPKRKLLSGIINGMLSLCLLIAIGLAVYSYYHMDDVVYTDDAQVEEYINPVNTRVTGYLKDIRFTDHQRCKKGDTLVTIDDREFRIAVEQASQMGWERYTGLRGTIIAMKTFGASAPLKELLVKFGFTGENVYAAAKAQLARKE